MTDKEYILVLEKQLIPQSEELTKFKADFLLQSKHILSLEEKILLLIDQLQKQGLKKTFT